MDAYRTEEEQIEAIKNWWQENGKSIIVGITFAVGGYLGWGAWQEHQTNQAASASNDYMALLEAVETNRVDPSDTNGATVQHLAGELKENYSGSLYSVYAAFFLAQQAVLADDLATAEQELEWALEKSKNDTSVYWIAKLRLAKVIAASGETAGLERALGLIENEETQGHQSSYDEMKGDLYLALGRTDEARAAYESALAASEALGNPRPLLTMKLNDLSTKGES